MPSPLLTSILTVTDYLARHPKPLTSSSNIHNSVPRVDTAPLIASLRLVSLGICKSSNQLELADNGCPSILSLIGRSTHENTHSDFIAALLDPTVSGEFSGHFFAAITDSATVPQVQRCRREVLLKELVSGTHWSTVADRRIDVLVETSEGILIIENKIHADESDGQTATYLKAVQVYAQQNGITARVHGLLLSPDGRPAQSLHFRALSYPTLFTQLQKLADEVTTPECLALYQFYLNELFSQFIRPKIAILKRTQEFWRN